MDKRLELHNKLVAVLGNNNVFFQPPEEIKLHYPCITYDIDGKSIRYANNRRYLDKDKYSMLLITKAPNQLLLNEIMDLNYISFDSHYVSDNLHHYAFTIYY